MYLVAHTFNSEENEQYVGCAIIPINQELVDKAKRCASVLKMAGPDMIYAMFEDSSPVFLLDPEFNNLDQYDHTEFFAFLETFHGDYRIVETLPLPLDELKARYGVKDIDKINIGVNKHFAGCVIWEVQNHQPNHYDDEFYTVWVDVDKIAAALPESQPETDDVAKIKAAYVAHGYNNCPYPDCNHDDIDGGMVDIDGNFGSQGCTCNGCHRSFTDIYKLVDVNFDEPVGN
jgi:hypothetical protein